MKLNFHTAYLITPFGEGGHVGPRVGIGFKQEPAMWQPTDNSVPMTLYTFVTESSDRPVLRIVGAISSSEADHVIIRDYMNLVESNMDLTFKVERLTLQLWHQSKHYIPGYDRLFQFLRTEDDLQRYYLEDLLEPSLEWRPEKAE